MKILVVIKRKTPRKFLVYLDSKDLVKDFIKLLDGRRNSDAIMIALARGIIEKEFSEDDSIDVSADMILTEENHSRDLIK